ncbi:neuromedin U receptor activity protein [Homalodisca vitripennis]|nr:neuromedin U receptor activity protein [Homalodisca vitripennis]
MEEALANNGTSSDVYPLQEKRDPLYIVVPITIVYTVIFFSGVTGNVVTCVVIARNKHMHTATNYYLFSLAISDLLLLVSGLPQEMYSIWSKELLYLVKVSSQSTISSVWPSPTCSCSCLDCLKRCTQSGLDKSATNYSLQSGHLRLAPVPARTSSRELLYLVKVSPQSTISSVWRSPTCSCSCPDFLKRITLSGQGKSTINYLFILAISDLLLLVSVLPQENYSIWSR